MASSKKKPSNKRSSKTIAAKRPRQSKVYLASQPFWKTYWLPSLLLFVLAFAIYSPTIGYEYVLDDKMVLTENSYVLKGLSGIGEVLTTESFTGHFGEQKNYLIGGRYRPLPLVSFAVEYSIFGVNSQASHFITILFYAFLSVLIYRVLCQLFPSATDQRWYFSLPFFASLLFVLHPIHTEVVANVKGRDEIMAGLGMMATLYGSLRYIQTQKIVWLLLSAIFFFLALLSKENALTFLAVVPLSIYFFTKAPLKENIKTTLPLFVIAIIFLIIRTQVIGYFLSSGEESTSVLNNPWYGVNAGDKMATVFYTLLKYIQLLVFPHPLTHDYYPYHIPILSWGDWQPWLSVIMHAGLVVLVIFNWKKKNMLAYGILFYGITLSIVSNIPFNVGTFMNERFIFIPSLGYCLILSWLIADKIPKWLSSTSKGLHPVSLAILGIFVAGFTFKTLTRLPDWKTQYDLNLAAAKYSPNSARANLFLGVAIYRGEFKTLTDNQEKLALIQELEYYVKKALEIVPNYTSALEFKSTILAERYLADRQIDPLLEGFYQLLLIRPNFDNIDSYLDWLTDRESSKIAEFAHRAGFELMAQQKRDYNSAIKYLNYGLKAEPYNAQLLYDMGQVYLMAGDQTKGSEFLNRAYQIDPSLRQG